MCLIRDKAFHFGLFRTIQSKSCNHWLIVKAVKIYSFALISHMLVSVPRRNAESIAGLPCEAYVANLGSATSCDNVVDGRSSLAPGGGRGGSIQSLCTATKHTTHFHSISIMIHTT